MRTQTANQNEPSSNWGLITWVTRGIETLTILSSLLWAIEVGAGETKPILAVPRANSEVSRNLASVAKQPQVRQQTYVVTATHTPRLVAVAPHSILGGEALAPSFKQTPNYIVTSVTVLRFKVPK